MASILYIMFPTRISSVNPIVWFMGSISVLVTLVVFYILAHLFLAPGKSVTKLTVDDMATISALLYEQDNKRPVPSSGLSGSAAQTKVSVAKSASGNSPTQVLSVPKAKKDSLDALVPASRQLLTAAQRQRVYGYIVNTYPLDTSDAGLLKKWIALFEEPGTLMNALKDHVFQVQSYFWLTGGWLYLEVIFWTWFGLLASLLFNVSESLRTGPNKILLSEFWTHIAKFFYAPLCSISIFLGLSLAIADQKVLEQVNFSANQILVAFILGFFSGRVIDLLQRIKNVILPDGTTTLTGTAVPVNGSSGDLPTPSLGLDDVETIIRQNGAFWLQAYPNVTGIAAQIKTTGGLPTGEASILFEVTEKLSGLTTGAIPPAFSATVPGGQRLVIPTDVEQVGVTRFCYEVGNPEIHLAVPTAVGGSVAAENNLTGWGTLGLRVHDNTNEYVLTCCHVVCGHLIKDNQFENGKWTYSSQRHGIVNVMVPGGSATAQSVIGEVTMASFSSTEDFALIRLPTPSAVSSKPVKQSVSFSTYRKQLGASIKNEMVEMVGAFSNHQRAEIIAVYQQGRYEDVPGLGRPAKMQGLVKTELLAKPGDSGGAVYLTGTGFTEVIGLVIASNDTASYVLPVRDYFVANGLTLST